MFTSTLLPKLTIERKMADCWLRSTQVMLIAPLWVSSAVLLRSLSGMDRRASSMNSVLTPCCPARGAENTPMQLGPITRTPGLRTRVISRANSR